MRHDIDSCIDEGAQNALNDLMNLVPSHERGHTKASNSQDFITKWHETIKLAESARSTELKERMQNIIELAEWDVQKGRRTLNFA
ncbi:MAG TPA: hypothetical protein VGL94_02980 [Ktedonobacteraceae bacterium]